MVITTVELTVTGGAPIHCAGCEQRINNALRRLAGVREVRASATTQQIAVAYDTDELSEQEVLAKLELVGFTATRNTVGT